VIEHADQGPKCVTSQAHDKIFVSITENIWWDFLKT